MDQGDSVLRGNIEKPVKAIGHLALLSAAFNILSSWFGVGSTFVLGVSNGGPVTLVYGLLLISIIYGATALALAELSAHYPTAGGQYHWTHLLAPKPLKRGLSYACGAINAIGRIAICASVTVADAQFIMAIVAFNSASFTITRWQVFLLYQGLNLITLFYNAFALQRFPATHHLGSGLSIISLIVIIVVCLAMSRHKQPSTYVWTTFVDSSGWNNAAVTFFTGLVNPNFGFGGLDGPIHLSEDTFNPTRTVPRSIVLSIVVGCSTAFIFTIVMLYCITDPSGLLTSRTGVALFEMWSQATSSPVATNFLMILFTGVGVFTVIGSVASASRLTFSFARDNALWGSKFLKRIDESQGVPTNALIYNAAWIAILGCLYLASTTAFSTIVAAGMLIEQMSFAIPLALLLWRRRASRYLPCKGNFRFGILGWVVDITVVLWTLFVTVIYSLPTVRPVTPGNMNYMCVVLGIVVVLAVVNWTLYARSEYGGPKVVLLETPQGTVKSDKEHSGDSSESSDA